MDKFRVTFVTFLKNDPTRLKGLFRASAKSLLGDREVKVSLQKRT